MLDTTLNDLPEEKEHNLVLILEKELKSSLKIKELLSLATTDYLKKGLFVDYEVALHLYKSHCKAHYKTEYFLKQLKDSKGNNDMLLKITE